MARKKPRKAAPRRARGTGSIRFDAKRQRWVGRVPAGKLPSGRTKYREVTDPTQAGCAAKMRQAAPPDAAAVTVAEWAERWLAGSPASAASKVDYKNTIDEYIVPTWGPKRLADLTTNDIEAAAAAWRATLGPNTLRKNLGHVRVMLEAARKARLVPENAAADARRPRPKKVDIRPLSPAELARVIAAATDPRDRVLALLAAVGCRLGEALALDAGDYDPAAGTVSISRTVDRHGPRRPKSENGVRTLTVPSAARPALAAARGGRARGPLFVGPLGGRPDHGGVRHRWAALLKGLGLAYRNPHQLRHSVATALVAAGCPLADVARYLGDSLQTVVRTYVHPTAADPGAVLDRMLKREGSVGAPGPGAAEVQRPQDVAPGAV